LILVAKDFDDAGKNGEKNNYKDDRQKIMFGSSYVSEDTAFEKEQKITGTPGEPIGIYIKMQ